MDRRELLGIAGAALLARDAAAQTMAADGYLPGDSKEFVPLWPGMPPGGEGIALTLKVTDSPGPDGYHVRAISQIQTPGFFVYRHARPNGLSLLVIPGGGYASEGGDRGGREIAQHFAGLGITCFVLRYRLPGEGWARRADVPMQDAQPAMPRSFTQASMPPMRAMPGPWSWDTSIPSSPWARGPITARVTISWGARP